MNKNVDDSFADLTGEFEQAPKKLGRNSDDTFADLTGEFAKQAPQAGPSDKIQKRKNESWEILDATEGCYHHAYPLKERIGIAINNASANRMTQLKWKIRKIRYDVGKGIEKMYKGLYKFVIGLSKNSLPKQTTHKLDSQTEEKGTEMYEIIPRQSFKKGNPGMEQVVVTEGRSYVSK